jgi:hypothetical protein
MGLPQDFSYEEAAEVYTTDGRGMRKRPVGYRRFTSSAEAIRFAIEQIPPIMQRGTVMEIGDDRYEFADIRALYENDRYPLKRDVEDERTDPSSDGSAS